MADALSPTSVLRLNFENLLAETTDPVPNVSGGGGGGDEDKGTAEALWDVVSTNLPDFVRSHKVVSWIEEGLHTQPIFFNDMLCWKKVRRVN